MQNKRDFRITADEGIDPESSAKPNDDRDEGTPPFEIDEELSSPDFYFSSPDPAMDSEPRPPIAPAWNSVKKNRPENYL